MGPAVGEAGVRQFNTARLALTVVFAVHAGVFAAYTPHVATIKNQIGLDDSQLGLAMTGAPLASIAVMLWTGALLARYDQRTVLRGFLITYCLAPALPGLATSQLQLFLAMAVWGGLGSGLNVSMNAFGVQLERRQGQKMLASLAAFWSLGAFAGAASGTLGAGAGAPVPLLMAITGLAGLALAAPLSRWLPAGSGDASPTARRFARPSLALAALGIMAFCSLLSEGAAEVWSSVFLVEVAGLAPALAGLGYTAYSLAMFVGRIIGDRVVERFGAVRSIRFLASGAAIGFAVGLTAWTPALSVAGFAVLGLGLSIVIPVVFRASGRLENVKTGPALAAVTSSGWLGLICGPPVIGLLAGSVNLTVALAIIVALNLVIVFMAPTVRRADQP